MVAGGCSCLPTAARLTIAAAGAPRHPNPRPRDRWRCDYVGQSVEDPLVPAARSSANLGRSAPDRRRARVHRAHGTPRRRSGTADRGRSQVPRRREAGWGRTRSRTRGCQGTAASCCCAVAVALQDRERRIGCVVAMVVPAWRRAAGCAAVGGARVPVPLPARRLSWSAFAA